MATESESQDPESTDDSSDGALRTELARVRAERDATRAELNDLRARPVHRQRLRRAASTSLGVVAALALLAGCVGIWSSRMLLDTDVWVERVGPLAEDPDVQAVVSSELTTATMTLVDPRSIFEEALPERGQILAAPLSGAVEGFIGDLSRRAVASDAFARLWVDANRLAHGRAVKVLRGEAPAVQTDGDSVTLNLIPVINQVLASATSRSPELFGRNIDLPDIQIDEDPTAAIQQLNDTFGTDLPDDFGQLTVYDAGQLKQLQDAVRWLDRLVWLSVVVFVLATVGAFAVSLDRRRTFLQYSVAAVLVLVLLRRAAALAQSQVLDLVRNADNVAAVEVTTDAILSGLFDATRVLLWLLILGIAVAWLIGPSAAATRTRALLGAVAAAAIDAARARRNHPATVEWIVAHQGPLRLAAVGVAVFVLALFDLSWLGILLTLAILGVLELVLRRIVAPQPSADGAAEPDEADSSPAVYPNSDPTPPRGA